MATLYGGGIVTNGLVLALDAANIRSYPTTGTTWTDLSNNGNTATLINGPTFNSGNGGGIQFDATDDYATIPDSNSLDFSTGLTISLWFNRGDILTLAAGDQQNLFVKGNTGTTGDPANPQISLFGPTGGGLYRWAPGISGQDSSIAPPSQILFANQWYNLVFTHVSGVTPTPFLNGVKQTNWTLTGDGTRALTPNNWRATICGDVERGGAGSNMAATFNGRMAIVMAYNRALSDNEVIQNFNATRSRFGI
jgi:hypothetical protein